MPRFREPRPPVAHTCRHQRCFYGPNPYTCRHNNIYQHVRINHSSLCPASCESCVRYGRVGMGLPLSEAERQVYERRKQHNFSYVVADLLLALVQAAEQAPELPVPASPATVQVIQ